ncbi:MAG TPA: phosphotransferase [Candidatus Baltobacteraceae bacterium]|jgi:hypothetical protein|nr:phosphotransferase [Candidatus Baltobacteraceae bacterium]
MFSPPDVATETRMIAAQRRVLELFSAVPFGDLIWGWYGRTLGTKIITASDEAAWLRVFCIPADKVDRRKWEGTAAAAQLFPRSIPRPALLNVYDWTEGENAYLAEITDYIVSRPCSPNPVLRRELDLPDSWWAGLRTSLATIATIDTDRIHIRQEYLDRALPQYLNAPGVETVPLAVVTAHGDIHWANLTREGPVLFDWESFGRAPLHYDIAVMHSYTLLAPRTAARLRAEFVDELCTPAGRFAELVAITELLQMTTRGCNLELEPALRERAAELLYP